MKQLTVIVKPFCVAAVLRAIADLGVTACVAREVKGYSRQKGYLDRYLGSEYSLAFLPKVEISVWVSAARAEEVADHIVRAARTGGVRAARAARGARAAWGVRLAAGRGPDRRWDRPGQQHTRSGHDPHAGTAALGAGRLG